MSLLETQQIIQPQRAIQTKIVTLSTQATTIPAILDMRGRFLLQNTSAVTIFIGGSSISLTNGWAVAASGGDIVLPVGRDVVVYGIAPSTVTVIQMELI